MKVIINRCYGGFGLSDEACEWLIKNKGWKVTHFTPEGRVEDESAQLIDNSDRPEWVAMTGRYYLVESRSSVSLRTSQDLIDCIETIGAVAASGRDAELEIVEAPDGIEWEIETHHGIECVVPKKC